MTTSLSWNVVREALRGQNQIYFQVKEKKKGGKDMGYVYTLPS